MKKITHPIYKDYPEQPYISSDRDLNDWENFPEKYPYQKVSKNQMVRLEENILPGDIVMLWRIGFNNFTTESSIPNYFEYRYGVNSSKSIERLIKINAIILEDAAKSLDIQNMTLLKRILKKHNLKLSGSKNELLDRVLDNIDEKQLEKEFTERKYSITDYGKTLLEKHYEIIEKHGPKM